MTERAAGRLRIDDLAQRSGIPSGTIRFYQREGLIAPPEREGRVAYYSEGHLSRLERVRALQAQGLPLSLVGDLLEREEEGEDVSGWLALDSAVFGRRGEGEPADRQALAGLGLGANEVAALERAGVLRPAGDGLEALPGMLEITARLADAGIPPAAIAAGAEAIAARLREIAEAMAALGWEAFAPEREQISGDEPVAAEVLARFEHLHSLARRIVTTLFPQLLDEAIRARTEPFADDTARRRHGRR
ncbi:MAG: MerR family transcriptional regulator [Thermoleophilaceae bacterium]